MTETPEQIVLRIFRPYDHVYRGKNELYKNIWPYRGKHYLEKYGSDYISSTEFEELMKKMKIFPIRKNTYPLQIKQEYYIYGL